MSNLIDSWNSQPPEIKAAFIAAVVSVFTAIFTIIATFILTPLGQYLLTRRQLPYQLKTEHEYKQRKELAKTINHYRGQILNHADIMKTCIFNLYEHETDGWLRVPVKKGWFKDAEKDYQSTGYYYRSTVYRFLAVTTSVQQFEKKALYIDPGIAEREDFDFVYGLKLHQKAATDASLFDETGYNSFESKDHFFSDQLRIIADSYWREEGFLSREEFGSLISMDHEIDPVLQFFDDFKANEDRLRWDRLVVFHLFLIAFINTFGYEFQRTEEDELTQVVGKIRHVKVYENLLGWLQEYKLRGQSVYAKRHNKVREVMFGWLQERKLLGPSVYQQNLRAISNMVSKEMERRKTADRQGDA